MQRRPSPPDKMTLEAAARLAQQCPRPRDFFACRPEEAPLIPSNLLCFTMLSASDLARSSQRQRRHHRRHVLLCPLRGSGVVSIDGNSLSIKPGEAVLIFPFELHYYLRFDSEEIIWFYITFDLPDDARLTRFRKTGPLPLDEEAIITLQQIIRAWLDPQSGAVLPLNVALLLARLAAQRPLPSKGLPAGDRLKLLRRMDELILEGHDQKQSTRELAAQLGVTPSVLRASFKKETGLTLGRHLLQLRLQRAFSLLADDHRRISEIADLCGFDSVYTFSRAFKKARGLSPSAYRQQLASRATPAQPVEKAKQDQPALKKSASR